MSSSQDSGTQQAAQTAALQLQQAQRLADDNCAVLRILGIDARVLEGVPVPEEGDEERIGWIEVAEGPIRWVQVRPGQLCSFWIPDSRIGLGYPHVSVSGFPVTPAVPFRRPKSVRWETDDLFYFQGEFQDALGIPINMMFSSYIADRLRDNADVTGGILSSRIRYDVETHLTQACWVITHYRKLNSHIWDCCQAVAKALLDVDTPKELAERAEELREGLLSGAQRLCTTLGNLGIDARELGPAPGLGVGNGGAWCGWIEVPEGPIRWMGVRSDGSSFCLAPDSRIKARYPRVSLAAGWYRAAGAKQVQWYVNEYSDFGSSWFPIPSPSPRGKTISTLENELSLHIADRLSQDPDITEAIILGGVGFELETDLVGGCWILTAHTHGAFTRPIWDCCQAVAEALLAIPLPTDE